MNMAASESDVVIVDNVDTVVTVTYCNPTDVSGVRG